MQWLTATEATERLGISKATLYAYVSRGYVRSEAVAAGSRERRYAGEDIERLEGRAGRRGLEKGTPNGGPVVESSITRIEAGSVFYRGHDVTALARGRSFEEVASLLWTGAFESDLFDTPLHVVAGGAAIGDLPFVNRALSVLPLVAARDALAFDLRPRAAAQTGWRIVNLLTSVATASRELEPSVEETLAKAWEPRNRHAARLLRAALIASADHEMDAAIFAGRTIASARSNPYAVVAGALAAFSGVRQGAAIGRTAALFDDLRRTRDLRSALVARLRRGEAIDGFGHPLHPEGDPRAALLFELLSDCCAKAKDLAFAQELAAAAQQVTGEQPSIEFALVTLARVLNLPGDAPTALFAIGRTAGWIAHAIEQYAQEAPIRPQTRYVGEAVRSTR